MSKAKAKPRGAKRKSPLHALPFVVRRKDAGLPDSPRRTPMCFWHVTPLAYGSKDEVENYSEDCKTGDRLAVEYLRLIKAQGPEGVPYLPWIVGDMPSSLTGIEIGFLTVIDIAARHGADAGLSAVEYWERRENERKAAA